MLCNEFEDNLTEYLDGSLPPAVHKTFAEHALRCPVCHETLSAVRSTVQACQAASALEAPRDLEARILLSTMPETAMTCEDFQEYLTDYLDGFLPAPLYHRWERHSILCANCTELPGEVVRSIGACYTYIGEEKPVPVGLNERILQATLGNRIRSLRDVEDFQTDRAVDRRLHPGVDAAPAAFAEFPEDLVSAEHRSRKILAGTHRSESREGGRRHAAGRGHRSGEDG